MLNLLEKEDIKIEKVYYCPHHPEGIIPELKMKCNCRKPESGMIKQAIKEFDIDPSNSFLIGDKETDIMAGHKEGIKSILVKTGSTLWFADLAKS